MNTEPREIASPVQNVTAMERIYRSKANRSTVTQRLYKCANGLSLGARKGGALHLSDGTNWEIFVLAPEGYTVGDAVGFVTDEQLAGAVAKLAVWGEVAA